jgi:hypothetical protein
VESRVSIVNDTPGLTRLRLIVDGKSLDVTDLEDGEEREVDVTSLMHRADNTITLVAIGKPGGKAVVLIADR